MRRGCVKLRWVNCCPGRHSARVRRFRAGPAEYRQVRQSPLAFSTLGTFTYAQALAHDGGSSARGLSRRNASRGGQASDGVLAPIATAPSPAAQRCTSRNPSTNRGPVRRRARAVDCPWRRRRLRRRSLATCRIDERIPVESTLSQTGAGKRRRGSGTRLCPAASIGVSLAASGSLYSHCIAISHVHIH